MSLMPAPEEAPASPSKAVAPIEPVAVPPPLPRRKRPKAPPTVEPERVPADPPAATAVAEAEAPPAPEPAALQPAAPEPAAPEPPEPEPEPVLSETLTGASLAETCLTTPTAPDVEAPPTEAVDLEPEGPPPSTNDPMLAVPVAAPPAEARVLHVINGEHYSGAERVQDLLAGTLPEHGYNVGFATLKKGRFEQCRVATDAPVHELAMRSRWDLGVARRLSRLIRQENYELVHAHTPRSLLVAALAARLAKVPLVYHVHSPARRDSTRRITNWINDLVERGCMRFPKQIVTVSPTLTAHMLRIGAPADRLRCVLNGVPALAEDSPAGRLRRRPIGPYVVAMVALFRPRKGVDVLLEAIAKLRARDIDVRLEAIGPFETPEYEAKIDRLVNKLGLSEAVRWLGFTDDVPKALAGADALALPSRFGEGLPMVVLEAMAAGLPVVATRCEGTTEAILHRETGMLVEPGSVRQMADALQELFTGDIDYPAMSSAARARHADRFSDAAMARQVAAVYDKVLDRSPALVDASDAPGATVAQGQFAGLRQSA